MTSDPTAAKPPSLNPIHACAWLLVGWAVMVNVFYERGAIEATSTAILAAIAMYACAWIYRETRHWLPVCLSAMFGGMLFWSAAQRYLAPDPYLYKAVKNVLFMFGGITWVVAWVVKR